MKIAGEPFGIHEGTFVMNYHHGLLRFGVVKSKIVKENSVAYFDVHFFEDQIHEANVERDKKMKSDRVHSNIIRGCYLKPVSPEWLRNVAYAYRRFQNERRTEIS
ncbi:MAG: hypothetical protein VW270_05890 [Candidatus Poseidoniales archaeon]|jgi:hypothetical protein